MRVSVYDVEELDLKPFNITKEELLSRLLIKDSVCFYKKDTYIIVMQNRAGRIYCDILEVVNIKKHLKDVLSGVKEALKIFSTDTFYLEMDKNNPHIKDNFYKNSEKVFENDKKVVYRRIIK